MAAEQRVARSAVEHSEYEFHEVQGAGFVRSFGSESGFETEEGLFVETIDPEQDQDEPERDEQLTLSESGGEIVSEFEYEDQGVADGGGFYLIWGGNSLRESFHTVDDITSTELVATSSFGYEESGEDVQLRSEGYAYLSHSVDFGLTYETIERTGSAYDIVEPGVSASGSEQRRTVETGFVDGGLATFEEIATARGTFAVSDEGMTSSGSFSSRFEESYQIVGDEMIGEVLEQSESVMRFSQSDAGMSVEGTVVSEVFEQYVYSEGPGVTDSRSGLRQEYDSSEVAFSIQEANMTAEGTTTSASWLKR